jgi:hypothetical protein
MTVLDEPPIAADIEPDGIDRRGRSTDVPIWRS